MIRYMICQISSAKNSGGSTRVPAQYSFNTFLADSNLKLDTPPRLTAPKIQRIQALESKVVVAGLGSFLE